MQVRRNGSGLRWEECSGLQDTVCPVADREQVEQTYCDVQEDCQVRGNLLIIVKYDDSALRIIQ